MLQVRPESQHHRNLSNFYGLHCNAMDICPVIWPIAENGTELQWFVCHLNVIMETCRECETNSLSQKMIDREALIESVRDTKSHQR
jgi:hypothetical protein